MSSFLLGTVVRALHGSSITLIKSLQDKYKILPCFPDEHISTERSGDESKGTDLGTVDLEWESWQPV